MTHMCDLLNYFGEFSPEKMLTGKRVPELLSGDAFSEKGVYNPIIIGNNNYSLINGNVPLNMENIVEGECKFRTELKRWYGTNNQHGLDRQLNYFDSKEACLKHYCAPINAGNNHWLALDVIMPNSKCDNGMV